MKKNRIKILIPNAPSNSNLGDLAIYQASINTIKKNFPGSFIVSHFMDYDGEVKRTLKPSIYYWTVFQDQRVWVRFTRLLFFICVLTAFVAGIAKYFFKDYLIYELVDDYFSSDLIFFIGGGYLRSKPGIKQSLNLFMDYILLFLSSLTRAKVVVGPISFGPFAYKWQEKLGLWFLKRVDNVILRENISFKKVRVEVKGAFEMLDLALHLPKLKLSEKNQSGKIIGFTIREWLPKKKQEKFEKEVAQALNIFCAEKGYSLQPIVQVSDIRYEYDDRPVASVISNINKSKVRVLPTIKLKNVEHAMKVYRNLTLLMGMRMHSNIIAATQGVPFLAISYEYKTEGIASSLDFARFCISVKSSSAIKLLSLLNQLDKEKETLKSILLECVNRTVGLEDEKWRYLLNLKQANLLNKRVLVEGVSK